MEEIIAPVSRDLLLQELTPERKLRKTNKAGNEIYIITHHNAPNVMREIGRLREIAFRAAGGGTGKAIDLDEFDTCEKPYYQLVVWNPDACEILGGYRFLPATDITFRPDGQPYLATGHMFRFSDNFIENFLPQTVELGRSFVTLEYQSTHQLAKSLYALDNLWDGLGALTVMIPNLKYFFGKMTMYPSFDREARDMILYSSSAISVMLTASSPCPTPYCSKRPEEKLRELLSKTISAPTIRFSIVPCVNAASTSRRLSAPT